MAQINKPNTYFNTVLYTGNGTAIGSGGKAVTGVGFQPDWVWIKNRSSVVHHNLFDIIRGATNRIYSSSTSLEETVTESLTSFDSDGFTVGNNSAVNENTSSHVAWNWLAGGTPSSNTDGSITSSVSANTTAGFSIVSYTGTGANATIGHGLGAVPKMLIVKDRDNARDWGIYHVEIGNTNYLNFAVGGSSASATHWQNTTPTSSVFSIGTSNQVNGSSVNFIAYCFAEKKGFSKFGSYTGNGSTDGVFVYTGFKPAFVMSKRSDSSDGWRMMDTARSPYNVAQHRLLANATDAEVVASSQDKDFLSNGFKIRTSDSGYNASGGTYIYMAFAENPLVGTNNIPACAR